MSADLLTRLRLLLEAERRALRAGDVEGLGKFLSQKEELARELAASDLDPADPEVAVLRGLARSNAALFEAAGRGVRKAIDRFAERTRVAGHLDTYDRTGRRRSFPAAPLAAPRRA